MTSATQHNNRWIEASPASPCPSCGAKQWCRVSPDGRHCNCRKESRGAIKTGRYKDGSEYFVHRLIDDPPKPNGRPRRKPKPSDPATAQGNEPAAGGLTDEQANLRHEVYSTWLNELHLSVEHRENLQARGLTDAQIDAGDYRSWKRDVYPLAIIHQRIGNDAWRRDFETVPGFGPGIRFNAPPGLLIPVRDLAGKIIALVVRLDNPPKDAGKYRWASSRSKKRPGAPSPGSPAHVPQGVSGPVALVRIAEGQLTADVTFHLSGIPTVAFPGVDSWRRVLPILQTLKAETIRVAFDADSLTNRNVARCLRECVKGLQAAGYAVELERWLIEAGKGIDDVYAAGRAEDIEILTGPDALQAVEEIAKAAGVDDRSAPDDRPNEAIDDPHRLARLYVEQHGTRDGTQTLWNWQDTWHRWDGAAYRVFAGPEIKAGINRLAKVEFDAENLEAIERYNAKKAAGEIDAEKDKGPPKCRKVTAALVTNVAHALASECLLPGDVEQPTWLDIDAPFPADEILATASGLLHLPSLAVGNPCLLPPTPAYFSGNALPYGFDPAAQYPEWLRFLGSLWPDDPESTATLQEWFGYCLTGDTRQHKLLMLIGPPRSGKGTIARVLRGVIGEQNLASPTLASLAGPFGLWPLLGKLVALVADARLSGRTDAIAVVERLLSISGEDPQDVARKGMPTLAGIRLPARFVVMTNELPSMRDASGALTTRVILLRLTRNFRGREDKTLGNRLLQELPGILNWSIHGWQRLNDRGHFLQPESGQELIDDLADLASPIAAFVGDRCILGPEFEATVDDLFSNWRDWCKTHGRDHPGTRETFAKDLRAAYPQISKTRRRVATSFSGDKREAFYRGIGLNDTS